MTTQSQINSSQNTSIAPKNVGSTYDTSAPSINLSKPSYKANIGTIATNVLPTPKGYVAPTDNTNTESASQIGVSSPSQLPPPPPPKKTAVVSSAPAATQAGQIQQTANNASTQIANNNANNAATQAATDAANTQPTPTPTGAGTSTSGSSTTSSAEDKILNAPDAGMQEAYNTTTGQRDDQPVGPLPAGFSSQNPQTRTDVTNTVDAGNGVQYKQFSDGTYGRFNVSTGAYSQATPSDFAQAQAVQTATNNLKNIQNGILTPAQQSQIDSVTGSFNNLITQAQNQFSSNTAGTMRILTGGTGVGIGPSAISNITSLANDAATTIAQAQVDMAKQVAAMQEGFLSDDTDAVKNAYDNYNNSQSTVQTNIDNVQSEIDKQNDKIATDQASFATAMAKKYTDTSDPILPSDTAAQVQAKLATSPRWQQDQKVAQSLDTDETQFWADMALSGAGQDVAIPNIGIGAAAAATKVQILKSIADNAKTLGLSAQDVANSLLDKNSKAKTYAALTQQGTKLATQEQGVEQNFSLVKQLGAKVPDSVIQTGIPALQNWINTGTLAATNNPALNNWLGALTTTLTKYAGVISGNTGSGGVSQAANTEAQNLIKNGLSQATVNSYIDNTAIPEMKNTISGYNKSLQSIQDDLNTADGTIAPNVDGGNSGTSSSSSSDVTQGFGWNG